LRRGCSWGLNVFAFNVFKVASGEFAAAGTGLTLLATTIEANGWVAHDTVNVPLVVGAVFLHDPLEVRLEHAWHLNRKLLDVVCEIAM
jgi:hypothetical protein